MTRKENVVRITTFSVDVLFPVMRIIVNRKILIK